MSEMKGLHVAAADGNLRGPAQLVLTASVARRYYLDGRSKVEIAEEFGLSRFKVARLLDDARSSGLVRIEIGHPGVVDVELSARLMDALGLTHCVVTDTPDDHPATPARAPRGRGGRAAHRDRHPGGRAGAVVGAVGERDGRARCGALAPVPVVQLTGALARPGADDSSIELVREVARVAGGPAYYFYAPMAVPDPATARALRGQPEVARAFGLIGSVTKAVAGVGAWEPEQSTLYDATSEAERVELRPRGVCAEVSGVLIDDDGRARDRAADRADDRHHRGADARGTGGDRHRLRAGEGARGAGRGAGRVRRQPRHALDAGARCALIDAAVSG